MLLRGTLQYLSRQARLRRWMEHSSLGRRLTRRFVAGNTLDDALEVCRRLNGEGILVTLDHLGENIRSVEEGAAVRDAYLEAIRRVAEGGIHSTVSIKLTHFGLDYSAEACTAHVEAVVAEAGRRGTAVEVDMESHEYTGRTLEMVKRMHEAHGCVRAVIQAYLRRSERDIADLCARKIPVRLCKGAYLEPEEVAFTEKREVDASYRRLARRLMRDGVNPAMATHDGKLIAGVLETLRTQGSPAGGMEFQMLYGIRKNLQRRLVAGGHTVRIYVPYGVAWYPYFMRRLAERPANLLFLVKNLVRG